MDALLDFSHMRQSGLVETSDSWISIGIIFDNTNVDFSEVFLKGVFRKETYSVVRKHDKNYQGLFCSILLFTKCKTASYFWVGGGG